MKCTRLIIILKRVSVLNPIINITVTYHRNHLHLVQMVYQILCMTDRLMHVVIPYPSKGGRLSGIEDFIGNYTVAG